MCIDSETDQNMVFYTHTIPQSKKISNDQAGNEIFQ